MTIHLLHYPFSMLSRRRSSKPECNFNFKSPAKRLVALVAMTPCPASMRVKHNAHSAVQLAMPTSWLWLCVRPVNVLFVGALAPTCPVLDRNHVHITDRMPLLSTNKGYIGRPNTAFTVLSAHSVLPRRREGSHNRDPTAR